MIFGEIDLEAMLRPDDSAFGPETTRGEIPEAVFWSTFCEVLERLEPRQERAHAERDGAAEGRVGRR